MYAMNNAYQTYRQQGVLTANPIELIVMLYEGGVKQLRMASLAIEDKQLERANTCLQKAQRIVTELTNSLDLRYPIASELMMIYEFMLREISQANADKDIKRISDVIDLLLDLKDAWVKVSKSGVAAIAQMGD